MPAYNPTVLIRPKTPGDAVATLKEWGGSARLVAGNTTIYELAHQGGLSDIERLVDITQLGLTYVREENGGAEGLLRIGATTTFTQIASSQELAGHADSQALAETGGKITPPQVRNMGTIGGALCSGIPFYDMPTTVLAVGAELAILSPEGERSLGIDDLFVDYFMTSLSPEEMITEVRVRRLANTGSAFVKLGRLSVDFAVVNCAARVTLSDDRKTVRDARIALGAVANTPIRAKAAEEKLKGSDMEMDSIMAAAKAAVDFEPTPSIHASPTYKKRVIPVLVRDALLHAIERAGMKVQVAESA